MVEPTYTWSGWTSTNMYEETGEIRFQAYSCSIDGCLIAEANQAAHTLWHNPVEPEPEE